MWFVQLLIGVALQIIGYLLMPKPKQPEPPEAQDMDDPTAEAGRPVPVVFGTIEIKGLNIIHFGEKQKIERKKSSGSKKK